jgi:hypothetical protein
MLDQSIFAGVNEATIMAATGEGNLLHSPPLLLQALAPRVSTPADLDTKSFVVCVALSDNIRYVITNAINATSFVCIMARRSQYNVFVINVSTRRYQLVVFIHRQPGSLCDVVRTQKLGYNSKLIQRKFPVRPAAHSVQTLISSANKDRNAEGQ